MDGSFKFIVMEYVNGHTLKQLIKRRGAIPYKEAVWLMKQLSGALMEAHRHQIIHRDVKSQNVLIKNDGTVKVADFGIALANGEVHYSVGYNVDMLSVAPDAALTSAQNNWSVLYTQVLKDFMAGKEVAHDYTAGYEADGVMISELGKSCAPGTKERSKRSSRASRTARSIRSTSRPSRWTASPWIPSSMTSPR